MDGRTMLVLGCGIAGGVWVTGGCAVFLLRLRSRRHRGAGSSNAVGDLQLYGPIKLHAAPLRVSTSRGESLVGLADADDPGARELLCRGLWSSQPEIRRASVTALGQLACRHEWAVDGLIEALAEQRDTPARVAAQLDRVAPRADTRLAPLLGHPSEVVRYHAARLLSRDDESGHRAVPDLTSDPSPQVRSAALEALEASPTGSGLRRALQLLRDPDPLVRAQACRTASAISRQSAAPHVAPLLADASWEVREAAHAALVAAGGRAVPIVLPLLEDADSTLRSLAALVLQDVGVVDDLLVSGSDPRLLKRISEAGGQRLRALAEDRTRRGGSLGASYPVVEAGA
ncbi:MAG TPA: HEAT repeat domain-containing protein [Gaiellaceae bacterium]|nr:HEAT repeat domain-containing protein [Gaiellaceae bacterium]